MARVRSSVDAGHIADIAAQAHEANQAIDRRAFSWTELFNELEIALPHDVRIAGVIPHIDKTGQLIVVLEVRVAQRRSDQPVFRRPRGERRLSEPVCRSRNERRRSNTIAATLEGIYTPPSARTRAATP